MEMLVFGLLCLLAGVSAEGGSGSAYLPKWTVGIIAVAVFLVLAFAFLLFNHYVCVKFYDNDESDYEDDVETNRVTENFYEQIEKDPPVPTHKDPHAALQLFDRMTDYGHRPHRKDHVYENGAYNTNEMVTEL